MNRIYKESNIKETDITMKVRELKNSLESLILRVGFNAWFNIQLLSFLLSNLYKIVAA